MREPISTVIFLGEARHRELEAEALRFHVARKTDGDAPKLSWQRLALTMSGVAMAALLVARLFAG